jgi:hypothetical protein
MSKNKLFLLAMSMAVIGMSFMGCVGIEAIDAKGDKISDLKLGVNYAVEINGEKYTAVPKPTATAPKKPVEPKKPIGPEREIANTGDPELDRKAQAEMDRAYQQSRENYQSALAIYESNYKKYQQELAQYEKDLAEYQSPNYQAEIAAKVKAIQDGINKDAPDNWLYYIEGKYLIYSRSK